MHPGLIYINIYVYICIYMYIYVYIYHISSMFPEVMIKSETLTKFRLCGLGSEIILRVNVCAHYDTCNVTSIFIMT